MQYLSILTMNDNILKNQRFYWIDKIKIFACILVVLGHFYMSMVSSGFLSGNTFYNFVIQTVYTFHVPLFFVCSGFLYQHSNKVHSLKSWKTNVLDKLLNLGVPYFTFTIVTLALKTLFSADVNNPAGEWFKTLFISPTAPYWYLYALFFFYLIIPCLKTKKQAYILFIISVALKGINIFLSFYELSLPYIIQSISGRMIWFTLGILLYFNRDELKFKWQKALSLVCLIVGTLLSLLFYRSTNNREDLKFLIGFLFVISIVILFCTSNNSGNFVPSKISELFMPVYVLHTICAAGIRIILMKVGISNTIVHIIAGIVISFAGPAIAYLISLKIPVLLFFFYPKKALNNFREKRKCPSQIK